MTGWWRWLYYNIGWEYPNDPTEETKRNRHEVLVQIKSYGHNIKHIVLKEEGVEEETKFPSNDSFAVEVRQSTPTLDVGILENENNVIDNITDYTRLFEGIEPAKKKKKRRRNKSNNYSF